MRMNVFTIQVEEDRRNRRTLVRMLGRGETGVHRTVTVVGAQPCFWVEDPCGVRPGMTVNGQWRILGVEPDGCSLKGTPLWKITVEYPSDVARGRNGGVGLRDWYRDLGVRTYCADIRFTEKFRLDTGLHMGCSLPDAEIVDVRDVTPCEVEAPPHVLYADIEVDEGERGWWLPDRAENPVLSIGWYSPTENLLECVVQGEDLPRDIDVAVRALGAEASALWRQQEPEVRVTIVSNERTLFATVASRWRSLRPDILTGWNFCDGDSKLHVRPYDVPYLTHRQQKMGYAPLASWGMRRSFDSVQCFDLLSGYRMISDSKTNNALDAVAERELNEHKLSLPGGIHNTWKGDPARFIAYNLLDCLLSWGVDRKKEGILHHYLDIVRSCGTSLSEAFRETVLGDMDILHDYWGKGLVLPNKPVTDGREEERMERGGLVWLQGQDEGKPLCGLFPAIVVFDIASTYPSEEQTWNLSPETKLPADLSPEALDGTPHSTVPVTGRHYRTDVQGIIPSILERMLRERAALKREASRWKEEAKRARDVGDETACAEAERKAQAFTDIEKVRKFVNNSITGQLVSMNCRLMDGDVATDVGTIGQEILKHLRSACPSWPGRFRPELLYSDTDSLLVRFVNRDTLREASCEEAWDEGIRIVPWFREQMRDFALRHGCKESFLSLKLEMVYETLMLLGIRKRYAGLVAFAPGRDGMRLDLRGMPFEAHGRFVLKGLQVKRHDTPEAMRLAQKELIQMVLSGRPTHECHAFVEACRTSCTRGSNPEAWMIPSSLSKEITDYGRRKDGKKGGVPPAVNAAQWSNEHWGTDIGVGDDFLWGYAMGPDIEPGRPIAILPGTDLPEGYDLDWDQMWEKRVANGLSMILSVLPSEDKPSDSPPHPIQQRLFE